MLSLKDVAAVQVAVEMCNNSQLKKGILFIPDSNSGGNSTFKEKERKRKWSKIVEKEAAIIVVNFGLGEKLQQKVISYVHSVGMRMLTWAEYHERSLGLSRNYSYNFLNSSVFTPRGIVDCKKARDGLMNDRSLSIKQKYKLALLYCMNEHIPDLYDQMTEKDKKEFYDSENPNKIKQPGFVKFWSYYLKDDVDKLRGDMEPNLFWLQMAVKSGSKDVVEYCLLQTNLIRDEDALIFAALEAVTNGIYEFSNDTVFDGIGTRETSIRHFEQWVPVDYHIDVMCFLFWKMKKDTQIAFLQKDIESFDFREDPIFQHFEHSRVLESLLVFPHQNSLLKFASLIWDILPVTGYAYLLRCFALEIRGDNDEKIYGYDCKEILWEFLNEIPESQKEEVLKDCGFGSMLSSTKTFNPGGMLLCRLLKHENFGYREKIIVEWILHNATNEEKEKFISSEEGIFTCTKLMTLKRWELLDEFVSNCFASEEKMQKFKKELIFTEKACIACFSFITNDEWHAVESFLKWSDLSAIEINQLKETMINSDYGRMACLKLISHDKKLTALDNVISRCYATEEKISTFKKELLLSVQAVHKCVILLFENQLLFVNEFIQWGFPSNKIAEYKKYVGNKVGRDVCERLISGPSFCDSILVSRNHRQIPIHHHFYERKMNSLIQYCDCRWTEVEKFLTWCFSSEDEINIFKKSFKMRDANGIQIHLIDTHLKLIFANKWKEAEIFFAWLSLSVEEIQELKNESIICRSCMYWIYDLLKQKDGLENIALFLRWCCTNKDDVLKFKNKFIEIFGYSNEYGWVDVSVYGNKFCLFINEYLNDLCQ